MQPERILNYCILMTDALTCKNNYSDEGLTGNR